MQKSLNLWKLSSILLLALSIGLVWTTTKEDPEAAEPEVVELDPCGSADLPEGMVTFEDGVCQPTEAYYAYIEPLVQAEVEAGDEVMLANIKGFSLQGGGLYAQVDDLEWLSSSDGTCTLDSSAKREATQEVQNPVVPYCNPNGFLLHNTNTEPELIPLTSDVQVRLMEEFGSSYDPYFLTLQEFMEEKNDFWQSYYMFVYEDGVPYYPPFNLIFKDGKLLMIHQVYVP